MQISDDPSNSFNACIDQSMRSKHKISHIWGISELGRGGVLFDVQ
jgi:hypothetical protein